MTNTISTARRSRRNSVIATSVATGALVAVLGPLAGSAGAATAYPPSDSCAATVAPGGQGASASTPASCVSTAIDATTETRPSSSIAPASASNSSLAFTGSQVTVVAGLGALMLVGGTVILVQGRRHHN